MKYSRPNAQRGVGLIEVLISLLVLCFGMLGLAGLQMWSLRNNQGSMERSLAVVQTHSIVDAMRADRASAATGGFDVAMGPGAAVPSASPFAQSALRTWLSNLETVLGAGASGSVSCDGDLCTVRVRWSDQRSAGGATDAQTPAQQEIVTVVQL
ncbi:type IV pilus modification protein PilV [Steroidobacter sp.]|uniref:type IV pilus modification protein PilV n=1 Tax=Steroidobacter sp. TaxID=1978227 RepID=UPI001A48DDED|nr:type IV pilus modification protein PilV [Steroidobacter sp.]MBL8265213.1 type IV pilus modification protein PilV [Steroidobacter sp.]